MKSSILCLILFSISYCCCDRLLGGWSTLNDDSLKSDCLNKALTQIYGAQVNDEVRSQVSDVDCRSQLVNGLNIKCTFVTRGEKWECSFYKSFIQTLDTQLELCKRKGGEDEAEPNKDKQVVEEKEDEQQPSLTANENEEAEPAATVSSNEYEKQGAQKAIVANEHEDDDEAAVDAMNKQISEQFSNNEEEQKK